MKSIMEVEKQLLMINGTDEKFKLSMNDLCKLKKCINEIGEVTNLFFEAQVEYANSIRDNDDYEILLKKYHKKLYDGEIEIDLNDAKKIINNVNS